MDNWKEQAPDNTVETEFDRGPANVRATGRGGTTKTPIFMRMSYAQLTAASPDGFIAFFTDDCLEGSVEFTWTNPRTLVPGLCRFRKPNPSWWCEGGDIWCVEFVVEYL